MNACNLNCLRNAYKIMLWVFANQVISYAHACKCIDQQTHRETDTVTHTDMDIDTDL